MRPGLGLALLLAAAFAGCDSPTPQQAATTLAGAPEAGVWTPLGLQVGEVPPAAREALGIVSGVMVTKVRAPADRSRILPGDVIVRVEQAEVRSLEEFSRLLSERAPGAISLLVRRLDADLYVTLQLDRAPGASPRAPGASPPGPGMQPPATNTPLRT